MTRPVFVSNNFSYTALTLLAILIIIELCTVEDEILQLVFVPELSLEVISQRLRPRMVDEQAIVGLFCIRLRSFFSFTVFRKEAYRIPRCQLHANPNLGSCPVKVGQQVYHPM